MGSKATDASEGNLRNNDGKTRTLEEWRALNPNYKKTQDAFFEHQKQTEAANYRFRRNLIIFFVLLCVVVYLMRRKKMLLQ